MTVYIEAAERYNKAANQGHIVAQFNLAMVHEKGEGALQDKAINWYALACNIGSRNGYKHRDRLKAVMNCSLWIYHFV